MQDLHAFYQGGSTSKSFEVNICLRGEAHGVLGIIMAHKALQTDKNIEFATYDIQVL